MSWHFSANRASGLALSQPRVRCGLRSPSFQKKRPMERDEMPATIPSLMASSATSRWVQCVIGRPLSCGGSQAKAMIPHTGSGVNVGRVPGRGASDNRSATLAPEFSDHHRRHAWTVERPMPNSSAVGRTSAPRPANTMIRARTAICCGQVCCRTSTSNCWHVAVQPPPGQTIIEITDK